MVALQVGRDRVGFEAILHRCLGHGEIKRTATVTKIKQDASVTCFPDHGENALILDDAVRRPAKTVGDNIARPQQSQLLFQRPVFRPAHSVENRQSCLLGSNDAATQHFARVGGTAAMMAGVDGNSPDVPAKPLNGSDAGANVRQQEPFEAAAWSSFSARREVDRQDNMRS